MILSVIAEIFMGLLFVFSAGVIFATKYSKNSLLVYSAWLVALVSAWFTIPDVSSRLWNLAQDAAGVDAAEQHDPVVTVPLLVAPQLPYPMLVRVTPALGISNYPAQEVDVERPKYELAPQFSQLEQITPPDLDQFPMDVEKTTPPPITKAVKPSPRSNEITPPLTQESLPLTPRQLATKRLVTDIQLALIDKDCFVGAADGIIGSKTKAGIINFNRTNKIAIDWNTLTYDDLSSILSPMSQSCTSAMKIEEAVCFTINGEYVCE